MTCMLKEQDFGGTFMVNLLEASFCFCFVLFCGEGGGSGSTFVCILWLNRLIIYEALDYL